METNTVYDWQQGSLTLEKQHSILEKRREYLLQLMPDDIESVKHEGTKNSGLVEEWNALQLHRDKLLHMLIDKENKKSLDSCYLNLLHLLTTIGTFDHSTTSQPLKHALHTLYWELKKYFGDDNDLSNTSLQIDRFLNLGTPTGNSPNKRKSRKTKVKLSRPDLIPSVNMNSDSVTMQDEEYQSPKRGRYKPSAVLPSPVASSERTPLLSALVQSSSEWESTDESFCSIDITDLNSSACSSNVTLTPVHVPTDTTGDFESKVTPKSTPEIQQAPRTPLTNTPLNVSFNNGKGNDLVTPKNAPGIPNFGKTPVSTRTPLIRGVISYTPAPTLSKSAKRSAYKRTPYKTNKAASPFKRRSPHKTSPRRTTGSKLRCTQGTIPYYDTTSTAASETSTATNDDILVEIDSSLQHKAEHDVLSADGLQVEIEKENIINTSAEESMSPAPPHHVVDPNDRAVAIALQKKFQNYRRGGVYTSPIKIDGTTEKEESFNISID